MLSLKRSASPVGLPALTDSTAEAFHSTELRRSKRLRLTAQPDSEHKLSTISATTKVVRKRARKIKADASELADTTPTIDANQSPLKVEKGAASPRKQTSVAKALATPHPTPERWRETYDTIKDMRSRIVAPVDTMGCDRPQLEETTPQNQRFATLVSLMLSSQTKDEVTFAAVCKLRAAIGGALSVDALLAADDSTIGEAICKVGFWRRKTQYIKQATQILRDEFNSDVPKTVEELCSLPGVGPKMAFLALQDAWKLQVVNVGIGVDVHVHRITNRLGWHKPLTKTPEETRVNLESWLPLELHPKINALLVGFGQTVCLPVGPRCDTCELSNGLCPSARKMKTKTKKTITSRGSSGPKVEISIETEVKTEFTEPSC
ncbi:hypothetical protein IEO21_07468 [Rhodonia placenta]|uniref:Endonuclease III homolog n=1 Tax=Rhodonia placenta TaxID=104341 RepID=A0A8H7NYD3_9APHY|nr:hypothetical protein IEO21_07468 [Postia placenta]